MVEDKQTLLRTLPSVDKLLQRPTVIELIKRYGRSLTIDALRQILDQQRQTILQGKVNALTNIEIEALTWLETLLAPTLAPVINGTGIIVHTNLGRAPLSQAALTAIHNTSQGYVTLEYDPASGRRGSRSVHAEQLLQRLTGAEAALVVNNNAAAVLLMLTALCQGREVIISRGQLVEIGGGFRIPDVMAQSGAHLVEVGTTNRTHLSDFAQAINENTAAIFVAHYSNYKIIGFTSQPSLKELGELAQAHSLPLLYDQGSGALVDVAPYGLIPEPTVLDGLQADAGVVAFSGDKLLGGPQAGILCGHQALIQQLKKHPLARAMRADKLCLAALSATLSHYIRDEALTMIPVLRMIAHPLAEIERAAAAWAAQLQTAGMSATVIPGESRVGGGSLPGTSLPTKLLAIQAADVEGLAATLRLHETAVIGRIQDNQFLIDPRTVLPYQVADLLAALIACKQI